MTERRCTALWIMSEQWSSLIYFGSKSDVAYRRYIASLNVDLDAHNELDEMTLAGSMNFRSLNSFGNDYIRVHAFFNFLCRGHSICVITHPLICEPLDT